jgi:hypothetical protein
MKFNIKEGRGLIFASLLIRFAYSTVFRMSAESVRVRGDGYIFIADMYRLAGKKMPGNVLKTKSNLEFLQILQSDLPSGINPVDVVKKGEERGTWIHPRMATYLASKMSPGFAYRVSKWIDEWKNHDDENKENYSQVIANIQPLKKRRQEAEVRDSLHLELGGVKEVKCENGIVDIVSEGTAIEVKKASNWKHAIGQASAYSSCTGLEPAVYLYDHAKMGDSRKSNIAKACSKIGVRLKFI